MDWHHKTWIYSTFIQENPQVLEVLTSKCLKSSEFDQSGLNRFHSSCLRFHVAHISRKCVFSFKVIIKSFEKLSLIKGFTVNWSTSNWIRTNQLNFYKQICEWLKALARVFVQLSILMTRCAWNLLGFANALIFLIPNTFPLSAVLATSLQKQVYQLVMSISLPPALMVF